MAEGSSVTTSELRIPGDLRFYICLPTVMRGSAVGDRIFPTLLVGLIMNEKEENTKEADDPPKSPMKTESTSVNIDAPYIQTNENDKVIKPEVLSGSALKGAAKKRFKWLVKKGHTKEEAFELVKQRINDTFKQEYKKRPVPNDFEEQNAKKVKSAENLTSPNRPNKKTTEKKSPQQAFEQVRIGILAKDYPDTLITTSEQKLIQEAILEKVIEQEEAAVKPRFINAFHRQGYLLITCANNDTAEWLKSISDTLVPWEGAELKVVNETEIARPKILVGDFPQSGEWTDDRILKLIKVQNEELYVSKWKIIRRIQDGSMTEITLAVDHPSARKMRKAGKVNSSIFYQFGKVFLRTGKLKDRRRSSLSKPEEPQPGSSKEDSDPPFVGNSPEALLGAASRPAEDVSVMENGPFKETEGLQNRFQWLHKTPVDSIPF